MAGLMLGISIVAHAGTKPVCILKHDSSDISSGTPCTTAKNAHDGTNTLVNFDSGCTGGTYSVNVVFEQESGAAETLVSFQTSVEYDSSELVTPTCTVDPEDYFSDELVSPECPATYETTRTYVYGAQANMFGDNWPDGDPNFRLMQIDFASLGITEGATGTLEFFGEVPSQVTRVTNADETINDENMNAEVICSTPPKKVKAPTGVSVTSTPQSGCTPTSGTADVTISYTAPTKVIDMGTSAEETPPSGCAIGVKVNETSPTSAVISSGTTASSVSTTCTIDGGTTTYSYEVIGTCTGGGANDSDAVAATLSGGCVCGEKPVITSVKVNGVDYSSDPKNYGVFQGSDITFTGTVTDADTTLTELEATLYYETAASASRSRGLAAATEVTADVDSSGGFTLKLPGSAVSEDAAIYWAVGVEDPVLKTSVYKPDDADPTSLDTTGSSIPTTAIQVGTYLWFAQGKEPYPNQYPFRAGGQRLVVGFQINEASAVTMRIYSPDGTLVRQIEDSTQDPESNDNVCNYAKGCSWDGTTYLGGNNYVANGLYIVNIYAIGKGGDGTSFGGQTINYTKGIVVMK